MKLLLGAAAAAALLASAPAFAQTYGTTQAYGNIGYSALQGGGDDDDTTLSAITGRFGAKLTPNFGLEGQASFGIGSEEVEGVDISLNNEISGYVVGFLPISPAFELIGRVGYGRAEIEADVAGLDVTVEGSGVAFGVGGQYFFDGLNGIRADYTRQSFDDDAGEIEGGDIDAFTVAYTRRF